MKKIFAIAMAVVMLFAMTIAVSADEVVYTEDILFMTASSWTQTELEITVADFVAALQTSGAELRIHRSEAAPEDYWGVEGGYEKFCITDGWWAGRIPNDAGEEINTVRLGTGVHTIANSVELNQPYDVSLDCLYDDGIVVAYDANALATILVDCGFTSGGSSVQFISNTSVSNYDITNITIVVPDTPYVAPEVEEEPAPEEPAVEPEVETEEPEVEAEDTPADTGLTLAVLPAVIALAVVSFKKR